MAKNLLKILLVIILKEWDSYSFETSDWSLNANVMKDYIHFQTKNCDILFV